MEALLFFITLKMELDCKMLEKAKQRICKAFNKGKGLCLSPDECLAVAMALGLTEQLEDDDHPCFHIKTQAILISGNDPCPGDGWYKCKECSKYNNEEKKK